MIIKVSGISFTAQQYYQHQPQHQTHYYKPQATREEVKQDFGYLLDTQIKGLSFNKII